MNDFHYDSPYQEKKKKIWIYINPAVFELWNHHKTIEIHRSFWNLAYCEQDAVPFIW